MKKELEFSAMIINRLRTSKFLSLRTLKEIASGYGIDKGYIPIMKELIVNNEIKSIIIICCPHCYNDVGKGDDHIMGDLIECLSCGKTFNYSRDDRVLYFTRVLLNRLIDDR